MSKLVALAALAVVLMAQVASAHHHHHHDEKLEQDFKDCMCWDSTKNEFCNGPEWYNSDSCNKLLRHAFGFVPVAFVGALVMIFFPMIFYCARWCCRCCGGRYSTRGCCCSDVSSRRTFPLYKNRTIYCVKGFFFAVFIATIPVSIVLFARNPQLHDSMLGSVSTVGTAVDALTANLTASAASTAALATDGSLSAPGLAPASLAEAAQAMSAGWAKYSGKFHDVLHHIERAESHHLFGRNVITYVVPASGLLVLIATSMLALSNLRQLVGLMMVAMCFHTATTAFIQTPQHVASVSTNLVCATYDAVAVPVIKGQATVNGLCAVPAVESGLETLKERTRAHVTEHQTDFCRDYKAACEATDKCVATPCDDADMYPARVSRVYFAEDPVVAVRNLNALLNIVTPLANDGNISPAAQGAASRLVRFQATTLPQLATAFGTLYFLNHECAAVVAAVTGDIETRLCGAKHDNAGLAGHLNAVSGLMCALIPLGAFAAVVMCFGMKRFRARNSFNMLRGAETDETAPIMRGAADTTVVVAAVHNGALNDADAVSGVVVEKEVAYVPEVPTTTYGAADGYRKV